MIENASLNSVFASLAKLALLSAMITLTENQKTIINFEKRAVFEVMTLQTIYGTKLHVFCLKRTIMRFLTANLSLASTKLNRDGDIFTHLQPELPPNFFRFLRLR